MLSRKYFWILDKVYWITFVSQHFLVPFLFCSTAAVGVATDVAVNGAIGFGTWYTIKTWLLKGGAAAIAVEVVFALATFAVAKKAMDGGAEDQEVESASKTNTFEAKTFQTDALEQEVADALAMAEKALKSSSNNK